MMIKMKLFYREDANIHSFVNVPSLSRQSSVVRYYWSEVTDSILCADVFGDYAFPSKCKDRGKEVRSIKLR